jgi:hypothetical protein
MCVRACVCECAWGWGGGTRWTRPRATSAVGTQGCGVTAPVCSPSDRSCTLPTALAGPAAKHSSLHVSSGARVPSPCACTHPSPTHVTHTARPLLQHLLCSVCQSCRSFLAPGVHLRYRVVVPAGASRVVHLDPRRAQQVMTNGLRCAPDLHWVRGEGNCAGRRVDCVAGAVRKLTAACLFASFTHAATPASSRQLELSRCRPRWW